MAKRRKSSTRRAKRAAPKSAKRREAKPAGATAANGRATKPGKDKAGKSGKKKRKRPPEVEVRKSPIHGKGLFAAESIPKNTLIGKYEGMFTREDGMHVLWIDEEFGIDGQNVLRYVNHDSDANADFEEEELWSKRRIAKGEEITHDYGDGWD